MGMPSGLDMLPEGVVSTILSLTTPLDACTFSVVSTTFRSAAESDVIWERFLPPDYYQLLSSFDLPFKFTTKKQLFFHLCSSLLIDGGRKSFKIEKWSGRKSYILSARELSITWSHDPMYWSWKHIPESRFPEAVELRTTYWLEIHGKITTQMLTKNTKYGAYLIMNISRRAYGLHTMPCEISVQVSDQECCNGMAYLYGQDTKKQQMDGCRSSHTSNGVMQREEFPSEREDGWMEIKLGEFFSGEDDDEVKMNFMEVKGYQLKAGLVIEGIEVRPSERHTN